MQILRRSASVVKWSHDATNATILFCKQVESGNYVLPQNLWRMFLQKRGR